MASVASRPQSRPGSRVADFAPPCFHGGAFFERIGVEFDRLDRRREVVNGDVLDAWFPPSPRAIEAVRAELPWLLQTSPPTQCEGLVRVIARVRGVPEESIVPGAGSSDLMFRALPRWFPAGSRAIVLDPSYGEYAHLLDRVLHGRVERFVLRRDEGFHLDLDALRARVAHGCCDLLVLVNPNNPTARHVARRELEPWLASLPATTLVWIDEAYVDYAGAGESLEQFAATSENVIVCKSLSKGLALSGARAAYLVAPERFAADVRSVTPPWAVSLTAQVAAVAALQDPGYYAACYAETSRLRGEFAATLEPVAKRVGAEIDAPLANWALCFLAAGGPDAARVVARCAERGVFLRDAGATSAALGSRVLRIAVRPPDEQRRIVAALAEAVAH